MAALKIKKRVKASKPNGEANGHNGKELPLLHQLTEDSDKLRRLYRSYQDIPNVSRAIGGAIREMEREVGKLKRDNN